MTPTFCACCVEDREALTARLRPDSRGNLRVVHLCRDCDAEGALAELAQHEIRDVPHDYSMAGGRNGNRQRRGRGVGK